MEINLIAAVSKNLVIGNKNGLPWKIPEDMKYFKELTTNNIVIMGYNTYLSLNKIPLKNRINVIITSKTISESTDENVIFISIDKMLTLIPKLDITYPNKKIYIIGGEKLYKYFLNNLIPYFNKVNLYITHIDKIYIGDAYFPEFQQFKLEEYSPKYFSENEKCNYQFLKYILTDKLEINNENEYINLMKNILINGKQRDDRTGTGTKSVFGRQIRFDISNNIPVLTTKLTAWKSCIKELIWFLKGDTNSNHLTEQGVMIWEGNTTREFLDKRGLTKYPVGDIGAGYGFQWRHFGAEYKDFNEDYTNKGFDQINYIINEIKNNPYSRRIYMSSWNPLALDLMALPPCHISAQFYVDEGELSSHMYQRSVDSFLGLPFNILSYSALTYIIANICDLKPKDLIISTGDTHIYNDHIEQINTQISRKPIVMPKLLIKKKFNTINEISIDDFDLIGYFHHPSLKGKMSV